jgi:hypothetical protein
LLYRKYLKDVKCEPLVLIAARERWLESCYWVRFIEGAEGIDDE